MNFYNEHDPKAAAWLKELIKQGHIPDGVVDERSIEDITPNELKQFTQCHFFAGIGGWSLALQIAGWPADVPVWSGSAPCQPFSTAGQGKGAADERHLWPVFYWLIDQCRPPVVFGEQVASNAGREWITGVRADLEAVGYEVGCADLCAAGVGAPHIRQRLNWVAHAMHSGRTEWGTEPGSGQTAEGSIVSSGMAYAGHQQTRWPAGPAEAQTRRSLSDSPGCSPDSGRLGNTGCPNHERRGEPGDMGCTASQEQGEAWERQRGGNADCHPSKDDLRLGQSNSDRLIQGNSPTTTSGYWSSAEPASFWSDSRIIECRDGKQRRIPTEPAFFPLVDGSASRVVRLRGYGNAIVPQASAAFIRAFLETQQPR